MSQLSSFPAEATPANHPSRSFKRRQATTERRLPTPMEGKSSSRSTSNSPCRGLCVWLGQLRSVCISHIKSAKCSNTRQPVHRQPTPLKAPTVERKPCQEHGNGDRFDYPRLIVQQRGQVAVSWKENRALFPPAAAGSCKVHCGLLRRHMMYSQGIPRHSSFETSFRSHLFLVFRSV